MGWSCTAKAGLTLDGISKLFQGSSNTWTTEKGTFFFETGRENSEGAITGQVWKMIVWQGEDRIKRSGSFRIEPDGIIARFPHLPAWMKRVAVEYGAEEYSRLYEKELVVVKETMKAEGEITEDDNMEIKIHSSWSKVTLWIFRSWEGERKLNGKPYHGPVFYLGSDNRLGGTK